jgi:hypothetical protein
MKTLKITVVATVAMTLAWWFRLPQRVWPGHPYLADCLMAVVLCLALQAVWTDAKAKPTKQHP